jgi:hypothetical protein
MLALKGIYNGNNIEMLEPLPKNKKFKVIVTFVEEIKETDTMQIREFGKSSDGFDFWLDEKEDLYQDYLVKS